MAVIKYLPGKKSLKSQLKYLEKEGKTLEELKTGINGETSVAEYVGFINKQQLEDVEKQILTENL